MKVFVIGEGTRSDIYLSLHGQWCIKTHVQVLHETSYTENLLSNLNLVLSLAFEWYFVLKMISSVFSWINVSVSAHIQAPRSDKQASSLIEASTAFRLTLHVRNPRCHWQYGTRTDSSDINNFRSLPSDVLMRQDRIQDKVPSVTQKECARQFWRIPRSITSKTADNIK